MPLKVAGFVFAPRLIPTLAVISAVIVLLFLGFWQLQRMHWKQDLVARITTQMQADPTALQLPLQGDVKAMEYRRAQISGLLQHDHEIFLAARSIANGKFGFQILTPLQTADGQFILINRGWVPQEKRDPQTRLAAQLAGPVTVTGIIRIPQPTKRWYQLENQPNENFWIWPDMAGIAQETGINNLAPVILEADDSVPNAGGFPVGGQTRLNFPDNHLIYALTWFFLTLALLVMYFYAHLKR
jgi:surfeit locus 1 family protein